MSTLISLLLPTRGRPKLAERFLRSAIECAENPAQIEVVIYADDDDPASHAISSAGMNARTIIGPRTSMGHCNAACLEASCGEIVILTNDDVVVRTPGWDQRVRETDAAIADRIYLAYPNDLFKGRHVSTFPILSRKTCALLGDPFPRAYQGAFIDYHLLDIFKRLEHAGHTRIIYLQHVVFEHMHYRMGKSMFDATYGRRGRFGDDATFLALGAARSAAASGLLAALAGEGTPPPAMPPATSQATTNSVEAILIDCGLPILWRLRLYAWFRARSLASLISRLRRERIDAKDAKCR